MVQLCTVPSTVGHEVYHCFGLAHTFDFRDSKRCEIGYRYTKTNNMLDYSHHVGIERNSLFFAVDVYKSLYCVRQTKIRHEE